MMLLCALACLLIVCYGARSSPTSPEPKKPRLAIRWTLLPNPDGSPSPSDSELVIENNSDQTLGESGWQLYFNFCRKIHPASDEESLQIAHLNGDLFRLAPREGFAPFRPHTHRAFRFRTEQPLIKETDAPSGFFLAIDDPVRQQQLVEPLGDPVVTPIDAESQTLRSADDQIAAPTPTSRYLHNAQLLPPSDATSVRIVPTPAVGRPLKDVVRIDRHAMIVAEPSLEAEAAYLANALRPLLGGVTLPRERQRPESSPPGAVIMLSLGDVTVNGDAKVAGDNAYRLTVRDGAINVVGVDRAGVFYGIQSLRALLPVEAYQRPQPAIHVEGVEIMDWPRFKYRGLHLDVARNFQTLETVKKLLEAMAFYKLNKLHFHLTDDEGWRLAIRGLPELTEIGGRRGYSVNGEELLPPSFGSGPSSHAPDSHGSGYYSRAEFISLLRYAAERHIEIIPEIDLPGHSRAAIRSMDVRRKRLQAQGLEEKAYEFLLHDPRDASQYESVQLWNDNVVNVCQESTDAFVQHVVNDLRDMYAEAGLRLKTLHLGGDEVPAGAWSDSPVCLHSRRDAHGEHIAGDKEAMADFMQRISDAYIAKSGMVTGAWEEVFLNDLRTAQASRDASIHRFRGGQYQCYVWNNVWGWGQEDAAYRLANAGVNVILCNATHLYFDLAYDKDPREPGYYWAGFVDDQTVFSFAPLNYLAKTRRDLMGRAISRESVLKRVQLTEAGKKHILGIQGQLWSENLKGRNLLEYMALPKMIALAERAWAQDPPWMLSDDPDVWPRKLQQAWSDFARQLGAVELPRLDCLEGGYHYRIPSAGAVIEEGVLKANIAYPGLMIRYTTDGTEPNANSQLYDQPVRVGPAAVVKVFSSNGRGGRSVTVEEQAMAGN